ncbi:hypothetical protein FA13DRAFT_1789464 [Coprinellus micaceus]|uniref:BUB1 N-terminal domain-containing protein n=1 Tax=Coprinellus micaceus TaxID=71717 RepID=A0A4Y7TJJ7_COPMI|nr:hypothetical protein FA13DRAFT_1789464 [Coprinellus micaceus]
MHNDEELEEEHGPVVVDFEVLERAKENVQPLATGRRVTALAGLLATPHAQREAKLAATRNRLRINVEVALEDEDGDPLEAAESGLLELIEEATRVLKDHAGGVCRGDIKYLKLWLLYGSYVDKPTIIYRFLLANDIGTDHALLYEEHAAVLERDGRKKEADEIYRLGIARKAQPLDHLKARYDDFQKRMMTNMSIPVVGPSRPTPQNPPRQALATTSSLPSSRALGSSNSATTSYQLPSNSRMQVFFDPTGEEAEAATGSAWKELDGRKTRVKENVPETKKLAGATIKQPGRAKRVAAAASGASGSSSSKIVPYRDAGADPMPPPPVVPATRSASSRIPSSSRRIASSSTSKAKAPAKAGFAIFSDTAEETPSPGVARASASKARAPTKGGFAIFSDPKESSAPAPSKLPVAKAKAPAKAGFGVFADVPEPGPSAAASSKAKAPAKAGFAVFADTPEESSVAAPKFTPFRDEDEDTTSKATAVPVGDSIIKVKMSGLQAPVPTTEAEALRKDPLKNYSTNDVSDFDY